MTDIAENLSQLGRRAYDQAERYRIRTVTSIPSTARVGIDIGAGYTVEVPCLASYTHRTVGDKVWAVMTDERGWLVLGRIGAADDTAAEIEELRQRIAALEAQLEEAQNAADPNFDIDPAPDQVPDDQGGTDA